MPATAPLGQRIAELQDARKALEPKLGFAAAGLLAERIEEKRHGLFKAGAPERLAEQLALSEMAELIPDIALIARHGRCRHRRRGQGVLRGQRCLPHPADRGRRALDHPSDYYDELALSRATDTIGAARRGIAVAALTGHRQGDAEPVGAWLEAGGERTAAASANGCRR